MNRQCEKAVDQTIRLNVYDVVGAEERSLLTRMVNPPAIAYTLTDSNGTSIDSGSPTLVSEFLSLNAAADVGATQISVAAPGIGVTYQLFEDDVVLLGLMQRRIIKIDVGTTNYICHLNRPIEYALTTSNKIQKIECAIVIHGIHTTDGYLNAVLRWTFTDSVTHAPIFVHEELADFVRTPLRCPLSTTEFFDSHPGYEDLITRPQSGRFIDASNTLRKAWEKIVQGIKGKGWTPSRILNILDFKAAAYDQAVLLLCKEGFVPPRWNDQLSTYYELVKEAADDSYSAVMGAINYDANDDGATSVAEQNTSLRWCRVTR